MQETISPQKRVVCTSFSTVYGNPSKKIRRRGEIKMFNPSIITKTA